MGMTMTQKILAAHSGEASVTAGQLINAKLDIVLGNDITTPVAINEFNKAGFDSVSVSYTHLAVVPIMCASSLDEILSFPSAERLVR